MSKAPDARPGTLVEAIFSRERLPWALIGIPLGLVEGATVAVFVKKGYAGVLPAADVNLAVALVTVRRAWPTSSALPGPISRTDGRGCRCWLRCSQPFPSASD